MSIDDFIKRLIIEIFCANKNCTLILKEDIRDILGVSTLRYKYVMEKLLNLIKEYLPHSVLAQRSRNSSILYIVVSNVPLPEEIKKAGWNRRTIKANLRKTGYRVL